MRGLPEETAKFVRQKEITDLIPAMDEASKHMAREGIDEFKYSPPKPRVNKEDRAQGGADNYKPWRHRSMNIHQWRGDHKDQRGG